MLLRSSNNWIVQQIIKYILYILHVTPGKHSSRTPMQDAFNSKWNYPFSIEIFGKCYPDEGRLIIPFNAKNRIPLFTCNFLHYTTVYIPSLILCCSSLLALILSRIIEDHAWHINVNNMNSKWLKYLRDLTKTQWMDILVGNGW